tara:strand:- start:571 stop:1509 length:939 start_codon:yes stop_codon:yes gene_type:complete
MADNAHQAMPDVTSHATSHIPGELDWVGMANIHMPTLIVDSTLGDKAVDTRVQAYVNLYDQNAKGIHMSRLYLRLNEIAGTRLSPSALHETLMQFVASHEGLSNKAYLQLDFGLCIQRPALVSDNKGWKEYPVSVSGTLIDGHLELELTVSVLYSSTCPCSAALARQMIQNQFEKDFSDRNLSMAEIIEWLGSENGINATPHSQRSIAKVKVKLTEASAFPFVEVIDAIEDALQTPVQTAVKRVDEQAFASLNGKNLMFCEDAARRIQSTLDGKPSYYDYWIKVSHLESLHAHDAVSVCVKGVEQGYLPKPD